MKKPEPEKTIGPELEEATVTKKSEQLLHALSDKEFDALLDTPFLGEEMSDHYLNCEVCLGRLERFMHRDFAKLSRKEREEMDRAFPEHPAQRPAPRPAPSIFTRDRLALAASEEEQPPNETAGRVPFGAFNVDGIKIEALADAEGMVFLRGEVPGGAKKLYLGQDGFVLKRLSESPEVEVEDLGSVDLEQFLDRHRREPESFPIKFGE
jgi:hypothetical protein